MVRIRARGDVGSSVAGSGFRVLGNMVQCSFRAHVQKRGFKVNGLGSGPKLGVQRSRSMSRVWGLRCGVSAVRM